MTLLQLLEQAGAAVAAWGGRHPIWTTLAIIGAVVGSTVTVKKMELPVETVVETLTNYNSYVDAGHDPEFGRLLLAKLEAPYCAVRVMPCEIITYGGIARNENSEVIRADGTVIPGLYTAGEASANSAYMGFTITNAFVWGRIAGQNAAAFVASK